MMPPSVAIIVPLFNEMAALPALMSTLSGLGADEVILVDGGSTDGGYQWLQHFQLRQLNEQAAYTPVVLQSAAGRAVQMNAGAQHASADMLWFLHADSVLPESAKGELSGGRWGRFDVYFYDNYAPNSVLLRLVAFMINLRSRMSGVATGDQGLFVKRALFEQVGGFQDVPIMEDVALSKTLRTVCRPFCSRVAIGTSARRWQNNGTWKTIFLMWGLRLAYTLGVSPSRLHTFYRQVR